MGRSDGRADHGHALLSRRPGFSRSAATHAGLLFTAPTTGSTPAERFLALTISGARKTLYITNSYFVPDDDFRRLLERAVKRGVDVRVLTVSKKTDVKTTWYAGRYRYEELLRRGVRIYEYQPTMMHSKTIIADGMWSSVGSMNFDNRSMAFNNESNLVVLDRRSARRWTRSFSTICALEGDQARRISAPRRSWSRD